MIVRVRALRDLIAASDGIVPVEAMTRWRALLAACRRIHPRTPGEFEVIATMMESGKPEPFIARKVLTIRRHLSGMKSVAKRGRVVGGTESSCNVPNIG